MPARASARPPPSAWPRTATTSSPPSRSRSQVTPLREEAKALGLDNLRVERLDLTDPYDIAQAQTWDFDVLWNNAGMGEAGPVWEIPIDLVRKNYEVNVFLPLVLTQGVVRSGSREGKKGKVVFTSSMGGLFTPANWGTYVSTKHALEVDRRGAAAGTGAYGIKVQTINPGAYYTGYNETMADNPFRWLDDSKNFTKRADLRKGFDDFFATPEGQHGPAGDDRPHDRDRPGRHRQVPQRRAEGDRGHAEDASARRLGQPDLSSEPPFSQHRTETKRTSEHRSP